MTIKKMYILFILTGLISFYIFAEKIDEENALGFLAGDYILIGKKINSKATYAGKIQLKYNENEKSLEVKDPGLEAYFIMNND